MKIQIPNKIDPNAIAYKPIAVLYQSIPAPVIDGIRKPMKPAGYSDSGADITFILRDAGYQIITPLPSPDPIHDFDWVFPDTEEGIISALEAGAEVLWTNTVLFRNHPIERVMQKAWIVGQLPANVEKYDDKWNTNSMMRSLGCPVVSSFLISEAPANGAITIDELTKTFVQKNGFRFPLVVKPIRGRGSQGVYKVESLEELIHQAEQLFKASSEVEGMKYSMYGLILMVEQYLEGVEITVTVMPPGIYEIAGRGKMIDRYWSLPAVRRFNHVNGIAPYNGEVAVVHNSSVMDVAECRRGTLKAISSACEKAAEMVGARAPIRIDCRAMGKDDFVLFDLNMKPNMTGAGRPGRDDQDSLTAMAARAIGWSYKDLLVNILRQAWREEK